MVATVTDADKVDESIPASVSDINSDTRTDNVTSTTVDTQLAATTTAKVKSLLKRRKVQSVLSCKNVKCKCKNDYSVRNDKSLLGHCTREKKIRDCDRKERKGGI